MWTTACASPPGPASQHRLLSTYAPGRACCSAAAFNSAMRARSCRTSLGALSETGRAALAGIAAPLRHATGWTSAESSGRTLDSMGCRISTWRTLQAAGSRLLSTRPAEMSLGAAGKSACATTPHIRYRRRGCWRSHIDEHARFTDAGHRRRRGSRGRCHNSVSQLLVILHPHAQYVGGCRRVAFDRYPDAVGQLIACHFDNRRGGGELLGLGREIEVRGGAFG